MGYLVKVTELTLSDNNRLETENLSLKQKLDQANSDLQQAGDKILQQSTVIENLKASNLEAQQMNRKLSTITQGCNSNDATTRLPTQVMLGFFLIPALTISATALYKINNNSINKSITSNSTKNPKQISICMTHEQLQNFIKYQRGKN